MNTSSPPGVIPSGLRYHSATRAEVNRVAMGVRNLPYIAGAETCCWIQSNRAHNGSAKSPLHCGLESTTVVQEVD